MTYPSPQTPVEYETGEFDLCRTLLPPMWCEKIYNSEVKYSSNIPNTFTTIFNKSSSKGTLSFLQLWCPKLKCYQHYSISKLPCPLRWTFNAPKHDSIASSLDSSSILSMMRVSFLGASTHGLFNFHPNVRPVPLELHIQVYTRPKGV